MKIRPYMSIFEIGSSIATAFPAPSIPTPHMDKEKLIPIVLLVLNIPLFLFIGRRIFGFLSNFFADFKWKLIPDFYSLFRGKFLRDMMGENRSGMFFLTCIGIYLVELIIVSNFL
jgi:hypothetical protein